MPWKCFMVEESGIFRRSLRRYWKLPPGVHKGHFHDASVVIKERCSSPEPSGRSTTGEGWESHPRWPTHCACGYAFVGEDWRQMNEHLLYRGAPDGKLYPLRELPPGAIWRCTWMEDLKENPYCAPDGKVWAVMLPSGMEFLIYGPSSDKPPRKWVVTGTLPLINVSPSINQEGYYHGYIGQPHAPAPGIITEDCEGRPFPGLARTA